jgi:hypothetical protein
MARLIGEQSEAAAERQALIAAETMGRTLEVGERHALKPTWTETSHLPIRPKSRASRCTTT